MGRTQLAEDQVEAEVVEAKVAGSNVVMFNLTDGTRIKATVAISQVLRSRERNPDGSPKYNANVNVHLEFLQPPGKVVKVPRSVFGPPQPPAKPKDTRQVA
jgi:hypothetical protein